MQQRTLPIMRQLLMTMLIFGCVGATAETRIHRGLGPSPDTLDIHQSQGLSAFNLLRDLHEGLLTRDARGRPVAGIARDWRASDDGLRWTFHLDPDARWSDGEPVTADDFVRGFERARDPATASPTAGWLDPISDIRALSPDRLEIELERALPWFEELLTLPVMFPYPEHGRNVYSGAFELIEQVPGSAFRLARNPRFRDVETVSIDGVVWHVTEDPSAELARFRAGELQITETVPPGRHDWLVEQFAGAYRVAPYLGSFYLAYNLSSAPLGDEPRVREALSLAIDRKILTERVLGSGELPALRLVPPGLEGWSVPPASAATGPDLERARRLMREAGYDRRRPLDVELRFNSSLSHRRLAAAVAAMWKQHLGVRTRLVNEEWKVFVTNRRHGRITEIVRGGWIADWADPGNFLDNFHSQSALNYAFFDDPDYDRLLEQASKRTGPERLELLARAEQRLLERHAIIPLYYYVSRHLVDPAISGYEDNPMDIHLSRWLSLER